MMTSKEIEAAIERLRSMKMADRDFIVDVCRALLGDEVTGHELHYMLIDLLEQANPDMHITLPKDADGIPLRIGDTVWDGSGFEWKVDSIEVKCSKGNIVSGFFDADSLTHHPPVTVESVLEEYVERWHDTLHDDIPALTAEYAKRLREVMSDE